MSAVMSSPASPAAAAKGPARWIVPLLLVVVAVAGAMLPKLVASPFYLSLLANGVMLGIAALGLGFLMYQCGLVLFGVAAFIGVPAYLLGMGVQHLGLSLGVAVALALLGSGLFALLVGALVVRARPLPFAMLTLALAQMLKSVATLQVLRPLTGGDDGLSMSFSGSFLGLSAAELAKSASFWPLAWFALCATMLLLWWVGRSRFGQILRAIKANEERMRFSGFDTYWPRLAAFVLAALVISVAGVLGALSSAFASPELLDFATGGNALVATLVGGASSVAGPVLGALLYTWGQDLFGTTGHLELLTGIATVVAIAFFPRGAIGAVEALGARLRHALSGQGRS